MDIFQELFSDVSVNAYVANRTMNYSILDFLFPEKKQDSLTLEYYNDEAGLPVVASVHAFDSKTEIASRESVGKFRDELMLVKRQVPIRERDILRLQNTASDRVKQEVVNKIYDDVGKMVDAVKTRVNLMAAEVLSTGQLSIDENNAKVTVDYGMPDDHKADAATLWNVVTADPLKDIDDWTDKITSDTGVTPTRVITSRKVMSHILQNKKVRDAINGKDSTRVISIYDFNELMERQGLPKAVTFDEKYRRQTAAGTYETNRYIPDNLFILMPSVELGEQVYGPTPEEVELLKAYGSEIKSVGNITAQIYRTPDPVTRWTKAVATAMPTFKAVNDVFIGKVLA